MKLSTESFENNKSVSVIQCQVFLLFFSVLSGQIFGKARDMMRKYKRKEKVERIYSIIFEVNLLPVYLKTKLGQNTDTKRE